MAIKIMDSFEPAGSGFKVVDAKDISVTENVEHDLKYALTVIGYLLGLVDVENDDAVREYLNGYLNAHKNNKALGTLELDTVLKALLGDDYKESTAMSVDDRIKTLFQKIYGNTNVDLNTDISDYALSKLKTRLDKITGDAETDGSFAKADLDLLNTIYISDPDKVLTSYDNLPDTHTLNYLHEEIETLKDIHDQINSVTYYAGVFNKKPVLTTLTTGSEVKDSDNDPIFFLKPGVVITVGEEQYITVKASQDDSVADYSWEGFGTATVHESRFQHIEDEIGTKDSTAVNNGDIWDNIKNIYSMLGAKNISTNDEKIYPRINSLETSLGTVSDNKPANTVWSSIESLYQQVKVGDIKIDNTSYTVTNSKNATIIGNQYISTLWAGNSYTFTVNHTFNKTPTINPADGWTITGHNSTKSVTNTNTLTVTATDAYGKSIRKTNTIYLEYPVLVKAYLRSSSIDTTLPKHSSSPWYTDYEITVDGSSTDPGNIMVLVYNPSKKNVDQIITKVKGNGFDVTNAFTEVTMSGLETDYVCYKLVQDVTAKTTYTFTINKTA